jgi:integrase
MRRTKGRVFKRRGSWYVDYQVNGERFRHVAVDRDGNPVTNSDAALVELDRLTRPYTAKAEEDRRQLAADALRTAVEVARSADNAARACLAIADAWERYPYTETARSKGARRKLSAKTAYDVACHWRAFAEWAKGKGLTNLEDVTTDRAAEFSRHLRESEGLTGNRHNKIIRTCSIVFRQAGRPDPFAAIPRYASEPESREALERDELLKVIGAATGELRRLFITATFTGLRMGDCTCLDWADVHLPHNRLIRRTTKSRKTVSFPLHPDLRAELEMTPPADRRGPVCPELAAKYAADPSAVSKMTARVFGDLELKLRDEATPGRKRAVSRRGFHSFRHSFATECARAGVPIGLVKEWLGHSSPVVTQIYEHWSPDRDADRILQALPALKKANALPAVGGPLRDRLQAQVERLLPQATVKQLRAALEALQG